MASGIDVYFTQMNRPWSNADTLPPGSYHYYVNVYSPNGSQVIGVPAPGGSTSISVPPGRYLVTGTVNGIYVNYDSNETVVNIGCNERVCVTIIPRSFHYCVWWLYVILEAISRNAELAPEVANTGAVAPALQSLRQIRDAIPAEYQQLPFLSQGLEAVRGDLGKGIPRERQAEG